MPETQTTIPPDIQVLVEQAPPATQTLIRNAATLSEAASTVPIKTQQNYADSATLLANLKGARTAIKAEWKRQDEPPHESIRRHKELFSPAYEGLTTAIETLDSRMTSWRRLQEELAAEEKRRLEEIANRERARLEAQAAAERAEAERKAQEKQEKANQLAAAGKAGLAAKARAQADALVEAAESSASYLEQTAAAVPAPFVPPNIPKTPGSYGRSKGWGARPVASQIEHPNGQRKLTSLEVLILAVANAIAMGEPWPETKFLIIDQKAMDSRADDLKQDFNIPGYESYWKGETTVSRSKK